MGFEVPSAIAGHLRRTASGPAAEPAPTRDSATVALVRDASGGGVEVYLLRRVAAMAAFGGMTVFPGGGVDAADLDADDLPWAGPGAQEWAGPLSAPPRLARALVCAAVRETFEEAGVLLAGPTAEDVVADVSAPAWDEARRALEARRTSLSALLRQRGLVLRADLLRPWAHWITPVQEPRRFDTRFFVAALPEGQRTSEAAGEHDRSGWVRPGDALAALRAGALTMVPPTALTLADLDRCADVAAVLAAAAGRDVRPVLPRLVAEGDAVRFLVPGDPGYDGA